MLLKIGYEPRKDADEINKFSSSVGADLGLVLAKDQPVPHQYRVLSLHGPPSGLKGVARVIKDVYKKNHTHTHTKKTNTHTLTQIKIQRGSSQCAGHLLKPS